MVKDTTYADLDRVLSAQYDSVNGFDFYRYIFSNNENQGELNTDFSKPNAIYLYQDDLDVGTQRKLRRRVMLNDTWENDYVEFIEGNMMTLCSGLSYRNRSNKISHAQQMNALVFDLDGVGETELKTLFLRLGREPSVLRSLPMPTFLVLSGSGLHVYYVFDVPIDLYPNIKLQLKTLKYDLTFKLWEYTATSTEKQIQYQSINQGFRMVGSSNNKYNLPIKAFQTGGKVSLDLVNQYARRPERQVDINRPFKPSQITRAEAKEAYPEWYQRVVIDKNKGLAKWDIGYRKKTKVKDYALYDWWIRQAESILGGHRYFFLMCLAIYACKCDVPKRKLREDMKLAFKKLEKIGHSNALTQADIDSALEAYDREYYNFTIADIEKLTNVRIERNKRNGRNQSLHLRMARSNLAIMNEDGGITLQGRPTAEHAVSDYRKLHPDARKVDCIRDTGLSKKTVYKWWNSKPPN